MAWKDLSIAQRSQLMNLMRRNGVSSLSEMRRLYDLSTVNLPIEESTFNTNPAAPVYANGGRKFDNSGKVYKSESEIPGIIVTPDKDYNVFLNSLPDNQRLTPESEYSTRRYWELNGRPKDFEAAKKLGMYTLDSSDGMWHANSVAWGNDGIGYFMKPKHHDTLKYELDWYNNGLVTEEGGKQRKVSGEEEDEWRKFRDNYILDTTGDFYRYIQAKNMSDGGNKFYPGGAKKRIEEGARRIKEEASAAVGSAEEYIKRRLEEIRAAALQKSRTRTMPAVVGEVPMSPERRSVVIADARDDAEQARRNARAYAEVDSKHWGEAFSKYGMTASVEPFKSDDRSQREHARLAELRLAKEMDDFANDIESGKIVLTEDGLTCINTATDNYGPQYRVSGNQTFASNPAKYGFIEMPVSEIQPGDIVQALDGGVPDHAMIYDGRGEDGYPRFNYSQGGVDPENIVVHGSYYGNLEPEYFKSYRFVGTPADSTRWRQEWLASQQRFGGNKFEIGGNKKRKETAYARKYREEQEAKAKREREHPTLKNVFRHDIASESGDEYYDVINARYTQAMDALKRKGFSYEDSLRLAPLMVTQNIVEGGWRVERPDDNNFGGLRENGRFLKFNSPEEYYDNYLDLLDRKWGASRGTVNNWRTAQNLDDWSRILNREDLHLWSKERYDAYNREHRDNPVYLYAPEWQNNYKSYREHLAGVEPRVNTYLDMVIEENPYPKWSDDYTVPTGGGSRANGGRLFKGGGPYGVVPLGGDYLSYLQTTPEVSGGAIEPSVVSAKLPAKFDGWSKEAIDRYAEGFTKGSRPVINKLNETGQKIFNKADRIAGFIPGPVGAIDWLGHMGYDVSQGRVKKAAKELATAAVVGAGLKTAGRGISWLRNYVDDATHFGEDTFRAFTDRTGGNVGAGFVGNTPPPSLTEEIYKVLGRAPRTVGPYEGTLLSDRGINTLADNGALMLQDKAIIDELHKAGVSTSEMTLTDIRNLYNARLDAARNYNGKVNIISQTGGDDFTITGYTNGKPVGYIDIYGNKPSKRVPQKGFKISYVANTSGFDPSVPRERGVQQRLSDAAIMLAKDPNVGKEGLVSGMELLMPERTTKMYSRYLDKEIIRNDGVYNWLDPNGVTRSPEYGPIYLLKSPAGEPIPTKMFEYSETLPFQFDLSRFRDGRYVIEQDGIFHGDGGKIRIKPENRGKFTALKKRTGHSASWFKAHGTPAQKKMAIFALNSRHWRKKAHGGVKF